MIIKFKLKNWGSYKGWETLDFAKRSKEKSNTKFIRKTCGMELLKTTGLVGINAGGKSLLLEALLYMRGMVLESQNRDSDSIIFYNPFLNIKREPTEFEIDFIEKNKRYSYGFSYNDKKVITEFLKIYDSQKATEVFKRNEDSNKRFEINAKYKKELKTLIL